MTAINIPQTVADDIPCCVARALAEDRGSGDITAELIPPTQQVTAKVISREKAIICGRPWVDEVFGQLDLNLAIEWHIEEGAEVNADQLLFTISGNGRAILTGERCALNFLQTLSATATNAREYANLAAGLDSRILDTRKTIPGLRLAQKYAVLVGGCYNHRIGLYDAFLIKENHIIACGGIAQAVAKARQTAPSKTVEVEVESLSELQQAVDAGADVAMLDNFSADQLAALKTCDLGTTKIEVSGNVTQQSIPEYQGLPIDSISTGSLTKHIRAIDLSMRLVD